MDEAASAVHGVGDGMPGPDAGVPARRRPRPVVIAAIALVLIGLLGVLTTWLLLSVLNDATDHGQFVQPVFYVLCYVQFALSGAQIGSGAFVWAGRRRWARVAAIVICSVNLLGGVVSLLSGNCLPGILNVVMNIALIRLLTNEEVYDWCHGDG